MDNDDREAGIKAVIDLQAAAGIEETREQAQAGWDAMSNEEQENTMAVHSVVCGGASSG